MKVFGTLLFLRGKQRRAIVAARSRSAAARLMGVSDSYARGFVVETGNERELAAAVAAPGVVLFETGGGFSPDAEGSAA